MLDKATSSHRMFDCLHDALVLIHGSVTSRKLMFDVTLQYQSKRNREVPSPKPYALLPETFPFP